MRCFAIDDGFYLVLGRALDDGRAYRTAAVKRVAKISIELAVVEILSAMQPALFDNGKHNLKWSMFCLGFLQDMDGFNDGGNARHIVSGKNRAAITVNYAVSYHRLNL